MKNANARGVFDTRNYFGFRAAAWQAFAPDEYHEFAKN